MQLFITMETLIEFLVFLLLQATGNGQSVTELVIDEGSDVILPCSLSTKEDINFKMFDWKKDGQKEVFFYNAGIHSNNGREGQDQQFVGRVDYFKHQLTSGNASITIRNTEVVDSGNYTCKFPDLQEEYSLQLVVRASPKPYPMIGNATDDGVAIHCLVFGASPEPKLRWQDSDENILKSNEPQVSESGGRYDVTLQAIVTQTKTNCFVCVATQETISHTVKAEIIVPEKMFEKYEGRSGPVGIMIGLLIGCAVGCVVGAVGVGGTVMYFKRKETKGATKNSEISTGLNETSSGDVCLYIKGDAEQRDLPKY